MSDMPVENVTDRQQRIKVLVVDDSAFARLMISKYLSYDPEIEIIGTAYDGLDAIKKVVNLKPDVITMDVEMPKMNGLTALRHIMKEIPIPVIMLSSLTGEGAETTIKALEIGAADFFLKPSTTNPTGGKELTDGLIYKIKIAAKIGHTKLNTLAPSLDINYLNIHSKKRNIKPVRKAKSEKVIIIGSSTGGPRALYEIIPNVPADLDAAILIVQHMPPKFTKSMADRLDELSHFSIKEAEDGDEILIGRALLAPGGYHMVVKENNHVNLDTSAARNGLRPAVDVTMETSADIYGSRCIGVVLTGMGVDGTHGASMIKKYGGKIVAQNESTCVVYGMPRSIVEKGLADFIVPLNDVVPTITGLANQTTGSLLEVSR